MIWFDLDPDGISAPIALWFPISNIIVT